MTSNGPRSRRAGLTAALVLAAFAAPACTDWAGSDLDWAYDAIPWFSTLREDVSFDPYEHPRLPAENSIPYINPAGDAPPPFTSAQLDSVGAVLQNPLQPTPAVLARGELQYERQCTPCHGPLGAGDGPVVGPGKFPIAPALTSGNALTLSDGYIYGVIRVGRGLMPAYGPRMSETERWAVVHYVRKLQSGRGVVTVPVNPAAATAPQNVPGVLPVAPEAVRARQEDAGEFEEPVRNDSVQ